MGTLVLSALELLLWSEISVVTALSLSAVGGLWWKASIAFSANHFVALIFSGESSEGGLDLDGSLTTSSKSEDQVEGGLLLDVVIRQGSSIFQLFTGEDKSLLIRRDTFFVLDLGFNVLDGVGGLDVESNRLTRQGLDENLHFSSI